MASNTTECTVGGSVVVVKCNAFVETGCQEGCLDNRASLTAQEVPSVPMVSLSNFNRLLTFFSVII